MMKETEIERIIKLGRKLGWIKKKLSRILGFSISTPWGSDSFSFKLNGKHLVLSSDQAVEKVHFDFEFMTPEEVGERALRCAISDIIATATYPVFALFNISGRDSKVVERIGDGVINCADKIGVKLIGGDISKSDVYSLSFFVGGFSSFKPLSRFGAKPGYHIHITGTVGDSALALAVLKQKGRKYAEKHIPYALEKFLKPPLRTSILRIRKKVKFSADSSDGPLRTVEWICAVNGVSAEFFPERMPFSDEFLRYAPLFFQDPQSVSATWGDDYEIVFGVKENDFLSMRKFGEVIGIILSPSDVKNAKRKSYPFKKIKSFSGKDVFVFFTLRKVSEFTFEHF